MNFSLLRTEGISKNFDATRALDRVDFNLEKGEVHALLGENGARKSTLMMTLSGAIKSDSGRMILEGQEFFPSNPPRECLKIVHGRAPLRINDIGGWTDTWFAKEGKVLNLAVRPYVEVQVKVFKNIKKRNNRVLVHAENYGESFRVIPEKPGFEKHSLLQFAIGAAPIPDEFEFEITLYSPVPAGISTGTSASVCVALLGTLFRAAGRTLSPEELASLAHLVETEKLKQQSGIQDQICAARGGVCFIDMYSYPHARVQRVDLEKRVWSELDRRLCLIYLGKPHLSTALHEQVITLLERGGTEFKQIEKMKNLAAEAHLALAKGDLDSYGDLMTQNNECQRSLYPKLISEEADEVARVARKHRASGCKVNGAGGKGGSLTILAGADDAVRRKMLEEVQALGRGIRPLPAALSSSGFEAWEGE